MDVVRVNVCTYVSGLPADSGVGVCVTSGQEKTLLQGHEFPQGSGFWYLPLDVARDKMHGLRLCHLDKERTSVTSWEPQTIQHQITPSQSSHIFVYYGREYMATDKTTPVIAEFLRSISPVAIADDVHSTPDDNRLHSVEVPMDSSDPPAHDSTPGPVSTKQQDKAAWRQKKWFSFFKKGNKDAQKKSSDKKWRLFSKKESKKPASIKVKDSSEVSSDQVKTKKATKFQDSRLETWFRNRVGRLMDMIIFIMVMTLTGTEIGAK